MKSLNRITILITAERLPPLLKRERQFVNQQIIVADRVGFRRALVILSGKQITRPQHVRQVLVIL